MLNRTIRKTQRGIWETDVRTLDLKNPQVLKWYVEKKIQAGDWQALSRKTLRGILPELNINPTLRALLENFFSLRSHHAATHPNPTRPAASRRAK